jgi:hypothetical protein
MTPERWREVSRIYGAVLTKPESDRQTALASLCANDAEMRREVESLLQSGTDAALIDRAATERPSTLGLLDGRAIGTQIGVFRIDSLLGVGMGEVYRARDTKLNRDVAIKILPPAFASDPDRRARFKREAQVLAQLNHPMAETLDSGAPKAASARTTRAPFSSEGSTHKSRSAVARGRPCTASAYAPTTRNRTSATANAFNRSMKSWFIGRLAAKLPELATQGPGQQQAVGVRQGPPAC